MLFKRKLSNRNKILFSMLQKKYLYVVSNEEIKDLIYFLQDYLKKRK